jgi:hypothetical protein
MRGNQYCHKYSQYQRMTTSIHVPPHSAIVRLQRQRGSDWCRAPCRVDYHQGQEKVLECSVDLGITRAVLEHVHEVPK